MKPSSPSDTSALLLSQLLALHLDRAIKRHKEPDLTMSKILEAARLVAERKKAYDERAQAIIDGMDGLDSKANQAFERPEGLMAAAEQDFKDLHKVFDDVNALSNAEKNDERVTEKVNAGSPGSSNSFPSITVVPNVTVQEPEKHIEINGERTALPPPRMGPDSTARPVLQGAPFPHQ